MKALNRGIDYFLKKKRLLAGFEEKSCHFVRQSHGYDLREALRRGEQSLAKKTEDSRPALI